MYLNRKWILAVIVALLVCVALGATFQFGLEHGTFLEGFGLGAGLEILVFCFACMVCTTDKESIPSPDEAERAERGGVV
jgi:hypothetical protein